MTNRAEALNEAHDYYVNGELDALAVAQADQWATHGFSVTEVSTGREDTAQAPPRALHAVGDQAVTEPVKPASEAEALAEFQTEQALRRIRSGSWLNDQTFPRLQWSVSGILPEGYALIAAPPKAGKSWLMATIGISCAEGTPALGCLPTEKRPVLYFALEDGDRRLQARFRTITGRRYIPKEMNTITHVHDLDDLLAVAHAFQAVHEGKPTLIIVDTLGKVSPGRNMSQSQYQSDYALGSALQELAKAVPGTTVLAVHHTNKGVHADFLNSVSGTQGVTGACDAVLVLDRSRKSDDAVLAVTGRDIENEAEYAITSKGGVWTLKGESLGAAEKAAEQVKAAQAEAATAAKYGDRTNAVLEAVKAILGPDKETVTPRDIADELDMQNNDAGTYLRRLADSGDLVKAGRGHYQLPPTEPNGWLVHDSHVTTPN